MGYVVWNIKLPYNYGTATLGIHCSFPYISSWLAHWGCVHSICINGIYQYLAQEPFSRIPWGWSWSWSGLPSVWGSTTGTSNQIGCDGSWSAGMALAASCHHHRSSLSHQKWPLGVYRGGTGYMQGYANENRPDSPSSPCSNKIQTDVSIMQQWKKTSQFQNDSQTT